MDKGTKNIMIHISTKNNDVAENLTRGNSNCQIIEEGIDGVTIIIVIVKVFLLSGINTERAGGVASWTVDGVEAEMDAIGTPVMGPAPSS